MIKDIEHRNKIEELIVYALLCALQSDDRKYRSLGPIHIVKYLYLADLSFAIENEGSTYTGIKWRFHHFGPWNEQVSEAISAAAKNYPVSTSTYSSKFRDDNTRFFIEYDETLMDRLHRGIPPIIRYAMEQNIKEFGTDTCALLHHVYQTYPMLRAAPEEVLDFENPPVEPPLKKPDDYNAGLTEKQIKERQRKMNTFKKKIAERLSLKIKQKKQQKKFTFEPTYDETFFEGVKYLDELAGEPIGIASGVIHFSDEIWKNRENE